MKKIYLKIEKSLQNLGRLCKYMGVLKNFQYIFNECKTIFPILKKLLKIWQTSEQNCKKIQAKKIDMLE